MPVSKDIVLRTSRRARLDLRSGRTGQAADGQLEAFAAQMEKIISYIDILETADTSGVEPMFSPMCRTAPPRPDAAVQVYSRDEVLQNAPAQAEGFFVVPKVL